MLCPTGSINTRAFWETKSHPLKLAMGKNNLECEALRELFSSCLYHFVWCNCSTFRPKPSSPLFQHPCKHGGCTFMETPTAKHPPSMPIPAGGSLRGYTGLLTTLTPTQHSLLRAAEEQAPTGGHLQMKPRPVLLATAQVPPFLQGLPLQPSTTVSQRRPVRERRV